MEKKEKEEEKEKLKKEKLEEKERQKREKEMEKEEAAKKKQEEKVFNLELSIFFHFFVKLMCSIYYHSKF